MFSIYEKNSDWLLGVIKFKNAYFLCEYVTDMQIKDEKNMTPEHRSFCYYGHKFEEYATQSSIIVQVKYIIFMQDFSDNMPNETINSSQQFTGVFQATINTYRLLYGAELDCVLEKSPTITEHIELKVCAGKSLSDLPFQ